MLLCEYLSVSILIRVSDFGNAAGHRFAGAASVEPFQDVVDRVRAGRFAHSVHLSRKTRFVAYGDVDNSVTSHLHNGHIEAHEIFRNLPRKRSGTRQDDSSPIKA